MTPGGAVPAVARDTPVAGLEVQGFTFWCTHPVNGHHYCRHAINLAMESQQVAQAWVRATIYGLHLQVEEERAERLLRMYVLPDVQAVRTDLTWAHASVVGESCHKCDLRERAREQLG